MKVEIRLESPKQSDAPPSYELARRMPSPTPRRKRSSVTRVENVESSAGSDEDCEELDDEKDNKAEVPDSKLELTRSEAGDSEVSTADSNELGEEDRCDDVGLKKLKDRSKKMKRERERQTLNYYDQHTHTVITRLRAVNKRLQHQLEQQNKLIATMTDEKKQRLLQIESLRAEVQMHKQTLRALHVHRTHKTHEVSLPAVPKPPQQENSREEKADNSRAKVPHSTISPRRRPPSSSPRVQTTADYQGRPCSGRQSYDTNLQIYMTKLEKFDEERKEVQQRHAHQLANYSHELSRLERLLEKAHTAIQEKENELRLHRTRQLYCHTPTRPRTTSTLARRRKSNPGNTFTPNGDTFQMQNIFSDDIWKELLPLPPSDKPVETISASSSSLTSMSFTTHVGQAFEQLLRHQLVALHDSTLDRSTRDWLQEVKLCGSQMVSVHQSFQVMARSLQRVAECTHMYQLAETLTEECRELMHAEQVLVLVVDKSEHEFWCRLSRTENNTEKMATVRSALPPLSNSSSAKSNISASVPCGLAAFVYHTRRAILLPAGHMTKHQSYSTAPDNADRLVTHPHASTLLVPIEHDNNVVAVVQVSGKLTEVQALGLSIALEKCDAFTPQDQALLTLLCHFSSGLFPKVAYFTDVESNKVNEETFIRLAPQIFTCLHFDQLGKVVIENAKNILDADRCSLFVADTATRTLHNWHSDISGAGVKVYQRSAQKVNAGMTIHFGQGIVGLVAETQESINIPDAYEDPRFNSAWDQKTHYRTKSMLTVPIISNTLEKPRPDKTEDSSEDSARDQTLLGVVQVINKSGGAPFRSKDEFLLQTISKLIALAIENSQLFQRNQELCWNVGKLIGDGDIVEAIVSLGMAAEQIIGVQGAAVYVVDPDTNELVTFHHKRRHRIAVSEASYAGSLMEEAVRLQQLTIVNDTTKTGSFNAFVDSLNGISARNVLFAPLLVEEAEGIIPGMNRLVENADTGASFSVDSGQRMVGLLQLVNTTRRKTHFDEHDLFLSIVQSQSCSVLAAILEKQRMLRQKEQIALLLDASMSFFKEMSVVGVINAVYNACASTPLDKMHERHMWSSKISPQAAAALAPHNSSTTALYQGTSMSFIPSLGAQSRKLSVVTDQTLRAPTSEGLFQQVLIRGSAVIVKQWIDDGEEEGTTISQHSSKPIYTSRRERSRVDNYTMKATRSDTRLGFTRHSVVACPVWSSYGQEIVGVLVLLFPRDHPAVAAGSRSEQLSTLPILTRQISGALSVCHDLRTVSTRARKMQNMLELSRQAPKAAASLTLTSRGHLGSFSQPVNLCSRAFNSRALTAVLHPTAASKLTVNSLYMDDQGNRWGFQISGATAHEMNCDHYAQWIGRHVALPVGRTEAEVFGKLRMDLQGVYTRKETITGVIDTRQRQVDDDDSSDEMESRVDATLSRSLLLKLRQLLWEYTDATWQVDDRRASGVLFGEKKMLSRCEFEQTLRDAGVSLEVAEWDQLYACFQDDSGGVDVETMLTALRPQLKRFPVITYELAPVLDSVTQIVVSVQMLLFS
ncbi:GAF domain-containing protein [Phytophthora infestans]|uniref:GAF domain-containing protein n=1 Tax=Phytophthora infestans TaxID=4787 RepID=A0A833T1Q5_PHYIN|nr:GAF domain-containing protein [Phytophthora infestans]